MDLTNRCSQVQNSESFIEVDTSENDIVDTNHRELAAFPERSGILSYTLSTVQRINCLNRRRPSLCQSISQHVYSDRNIFGSLAHDESFSREMFADTNDYSLASVYRKNWKRQPSKDDAYRQIQPVIWKSKLHSEAKSERSVGQTVLKTQPSGKKTVPTDKDHDVAFVTGIMDNQHTPHQNWEAHMKSLVKQASCDNSDNMSNATIENKTTETHVADEIKDKKIMKSKIVSNKQSVQKMFSQDESEKLAKPQCLSNRWVSESVEGGIAELSKRVSFGDVTYKYIEPIPKADTVNKKGICLSQKIDKSTGKPIPSKQDVKQGKVKDKIMVDALKKNPLTGVKKACPSSEIKQKAKELKEALDRQTISKNTLGSKVKKVIGDKSVYKSKSDIVEIQKDKKSTAARNNGNHNEVKNQNAVMLQSGFKKDKSDDFTINNGSGKEKPTKATKNVKSNFKKDKSDELTINNGSSEEKPTKATKKVSFGETTYKLIEPRPNGNTSKNRSVALSNKIDKASKKTLITKDNKMNEKELGKSKYTERFSGLSFKGGKEKVQGHCTQKLNKKLMSAYEKPESPASVKHKTETVTQTAVKPDMLSGIKSQKRKLMSADREKVNNQYPKLKKGFENVKDSSDKENISVSAVTGKTLVSHNRNIESNDKQTKALVKSNAIKSTSLPEQTNKNLSSMPDKSTPGSKVIQSDTKNTANENRTKVDVSKDKPLPCKNNVDSNMKQTKTSETSMVNTRNIVDKKSKKPITDNQNAVKVTTEKTSMSPLQLQVETMRESKMLKSKPIAADCSNSEKYDSDTESCSETDSIPSSDDSLMTEKRIQQSLSVFHYGISKAGIKYSCKTVTQSETEIENTTSKLPSRTNSESVINNSKQLSLDKKTLKATREQTRSKSEEVTNVPRTIGYKASATVKPAETPVVKLHYPNTTTSANKAQVTATARASGYDNQSRVGLTTNGFSKSSCLAYGVSSAANKPVIKTPRASVPSNNAQVNEPQLTKKNSIPSRIMQSSCKSGIPVATSTANLSAVPGVVTSKPQTSQAVPVHSSHLTAVSVPKRVANTYKPVHNVSAPYIPQNAISTSSSMSLFKSRSSHTKNTVATTTATTCSQAAFSKYNDTVTYTNKMQGLNRYGTDGLYMYKTQGSTSGSRSDHPIAMKTPGVNSQSRQNYSLSNPSSATSHQRLSVGQHASQSNVCPTTETSQYLKANASIQNNGMSASTLSRSHMPSYCQSQAGLSGNLPVYVPPSVAHIRTVESHQPRIYPGPDNRPLNNVHESLHFSLHEPSYQNPLNHFHGNPNFSSMSRHMPHSQIPQYNASETYNQFQTNYAALGHTNQQVRYQTTQYMHNPTNHLHLSSYRYPGIQLPGYSGTQSPGYSGLFPVYGMSNPHSCMGSSSCFGSWGTTTNNCGYNQFSSCQNVSNEYGHMFDHQGPFNQFDWLSSDSHTRANAIQQNMQQTRPYYETDVFNNPTNQTNESGNFQDYLSVNRGIHVGAEQHQFMNQDSRNIQTVNPRAHPYTNASNFSDNGQALGSDVVPDKLTGASLQSYDRPDESHSMTNSTSGSSMLDNSPTITGSIPELELPDSNIVTLIADFLEDYNEISVKVTKKMNDCVSDEPTEALGSDIVSDRLTGATNETMEISNEASVTVVGGTLSYIDDNTDTDMNDTANRSPPILSPIQNRLLIKQSIKVLENADQGHQSEDKTESHSFQQMRNGIATQLEIRNKKVDDTNKTVFKPSKSEGKATAMTACQELDKAKKTKEISKSGNSLIKTDKQTTSTDNLVKILKGHSVEKSVGHEKYKAESNTSGTKKLATEITNTVKASPKSVRPKLSVSSKMTRVPEKVNMIESKTKLPTSEQETKNRSLNREDKVDSTKTKKVNTLGVKTWLQKGSMSDDNKSEIAGFRSPKVIKDSNIFSNIQKSVASPKMENKSIDMQKNKCEGAKSSNKKPVEQNRGRKVTSLESKRTVSPKTNNGANAVNDLQNSKASPRLKNKNKKTLDEHQGAHTSCRPVDKRKVNGEKDSLETLLRRSDKTDIQKGKEEAAKTDQICNETTNKTNLINVESDETTFSEDKIRLNIVADIPKPDVKEQRTVMKLKTDKQTTSAYKFVKILKGCSDEKLVADRKNKAESKTVADIPKCNVNEQKTVASVLDTSDLKKQLDSSVSASKTEKETKHDKSDMITVKNLGPWKLQQERSLFGSAARFLGEDFNQNTPRKRKRPTLYGSYACADQNETEIEKMETRSSFSETPIANSRKRASDEIEHHSEEKKIREELKLPIDQTTNKMEEETTEKLRQSVSKEVSKKKSSRGRPKKKKKKVTLQSLENKNNEMKTNDTDPVPIQDSCLKADSDEKTVNDLEKISQSDKSKYLKADSCKKTVKDLETVSESDKPKSRKFKGKKYKGKASFRVKLTDIMFKQDFHTQPVASKNVVVAVKDVGKDSHSTQDKIGTKRKVFSDKKMGKKRKLEMKQTANTSKTSKAPGTGTKNGTVGMVQESLCQICRIKVKCGELYRHFRNFHPRHCVVCYKEFPNKVSGFDGSIFQREWIHLTVLL